MKNSFNKIKRKLIEWGSNKKNNKIFDWRMKLKAKKTLKKGQGKKNQNQKNKDQNKKQNI